MPEKLVNDSHVRKAIEAKEDAIRSVCPDDVSESGKELFKVINKT